MWRHIRRLSCYISENLFKMKRLAPGRPDEWGALGRRSSRALFRTASHDPSSHPIASVPPTSRCRTYPSHAPQPIPRPAPILRPHMGPSHMAACECVPRRRLPASGARTVTHGGASSSSRWLWQVIVRQPLVPLLQHVLSQIYF
jgi:hypothetical protein